MKNKQNKQNTAKNCGNKNCTSKNCGTKNSQNHSFEHGGNND